MRKTLVIVMLSLSVLVLGGCLNIATNTVVNEDGSGRWELGIYFDPEFLEGMGGEMGEGEMNLDIGDGAFGENLDETVTDEASGITFSADLRENEAGEEWIFVVADIPNAEAWSQLETASETIEGLSMEDAMGEAGMGDPAAGEGATPEMSFFPVVSFDGDTVRVEVVGEAPAEAMNMDMGAGGSESGAMEGLDFGFDLTSLLTFTYSVQLPEVTETNGELDEETQTVTWELDWASEEPIEFYAEGKLK